MYTFSAPITSDLTRGYLRLRHEFNVMLKGDTSTDQLYWAEFEELEPLVNDDGGRVTIDWRYGGIWPWQPRNQRATIVLNGRIPWEIEIWSGASRLIAALADVPLVGLKLKTGASKVEVTLGQPQGTVPIKVGCGACNFELSRPAGVPTRLQAATGASSLTFDGQHFATLGGDIDTESGGYAGASDRYLIDLSGGASSMLITTY